MRVLVFFDLPVTTLENRREYNRFRNAVVAGAVISNVKLNLPREGLVELLTVTERQFSRMEFLLGEAHDEVLNSDERLVFL